MRRFRSILFCPLGSEGTTAAARRAGRLAEMNDASFTVFGVVPEPTRLQRILHRSEVVELAVSSARDDLAKQLRRLTPDGADRADWDVASGDPALRIIERVLGEGHDLVVVAGDGDRSIVRRLLRKCPCPVWVIRPTRAKVQRVLAAVNPDPEESELNQLILELATSMYDHNGGELHLVHAWELYGESTLRRSPFLQAPDTELSTLLEEERAGHVEAIGKLLDLSGVGDRPWKVHVEKGSAREVIPALVQHRRINLLVMGTVGRAGVNRMIMGSTAERTLDSVSCSVIALKPEGFVSPIAVPAK